MPLDPGRNWLAAGITGIPRLREWDAVATVAAAGNPGDEAEFLALPDGRVVVEGGTTTIDVGSIAAGLEGMIEVPYRAVAVRREGLWAVGARRIEVSRFEPDPGGDDLELTWNGISLAVVADGVPVGASRASALERIARERERGSYAAHAHRLEGDLWEILVLPL